MRHNAGIHWLLIVLGVSLSALSGVLAVLYYNNLQLNTTILRLDLQHNAALDRNEQELSECISTAEMYRQRYIFLAGMAFGIKVDDEITEDVATMAREIDRFWAFRRQLEKDAKLNRRRQ